jgi:hypothetical protein
VVEKVFEFCYTSNFFHYIAIASILTRTAHMQLHM